MRLLSPSAGGASSTISGVPGYAWRHGCGPTAVGMVVGYYDTHGFPASIEGDSTTQTSQVNQSIASQGSGSNTTGEQRHYEDYVLPNDDGKASVYADRSENYPTGCHANDSIADFMKTSWSSEGNFYGWSWSDMIAPAFTSYMQMKNPNDLVSTQEYAMGDDLTWSVLTTEIDNQRPMVFLVDSSGDGYTDHFVTVVGYSDGPPQQYGCLDTWYPYDEVRWCTFRSMSSGYAWGVWGGWSLRSQHTLMVTVAGDLGGSIDSSPDQAGYDHGATVVLTANPPADFQFDHWSGDVPAGHETDNPLTVTMDASKTLSAVMTTAASNAVQDWRLYSN